MRPIKDPIRFVARYALPQAMYGGLARVFNTIWFIIAEGWSTYRTLNKPEEPNAQTVREVRLRGIHHPIAIRPQTPDVTCVVQNIVRGEYGKFGARFSPKVIIDAGAYIGDVSLYFLNRYPQARVIALEPCNGHYHLAARNLAPYGRRVILLQSALWHERTTKSLAGEYQGVAVQKEAIAGDDMVSCVDIKSIMLAHNIDHIDLLKLDIEGAEEEVLLRDSDWWLSRTERLIVEFHAPKVAERCTDLLRTRGFKNFQYRSLCYFYRPTPRG